MLRELADVVAKPLSIILRQSWLTGDVPVDWRLANVTPIFKKGQKDDPGSYRPISLTSVPGKVMEQIISGAIMDQLKVNQGIRPSQHGFMNGRSCLTKELAPRHRGQRTLQQQQQQEQIPGREEAGAAGPAVHIHR